MSTSSKELGTGKSSNPKVSGKGKSQVTPAIERSLKASPVQSHDEKELPAEEWPPMLAGGATPERPATPQGKEHASEADASEAFDGILDVDSKGFLESYDFSQEQIKAIEGHELLGVDAATKLISKVAELNESLGAQFRVRRREQALRALLKSEKGWTDSYISKMVDETIRISDAYEAEDEAAGNSKGSPSKRSATTVVNVSTKSAIETITEVDSASMKKLTEHLRRCVAENVDDNRSALLSNKAQLSLHRAMQAVDRNHLNVGTTPAETWYGWSTQRLIESIERAFPPDGDNTALDWFHSM